MNHQTHSPTSILTEDPLQALYQCNSFSVKASQMYIWCRYGGLRSGVDMVVFEGT